MTREEVGPPLAQAVWFNGNSDTGFRSGFAGAEAGGVGLQKVGHTERGAHYQLATNPDINATNPILTKAGHKPHIPPLPLLEPSRHSTQNGGGAVG